ncbi:hypothetical protein Tco_0840147 [Tanacetum coccineum]|uniref:Uncharacterized protein n=1 Tax=Tanacetum coccineum TaxID=301880 RepID=A0ABQ5ATB0_9ASTR
MHEDFEYVKSLEKEIDELESEKADFSNMYDLLLEECVSKDVICSYLHSLSELNAHTELQCMYLHKVKECECLAQKLSKQTESVNNEIKDAKSHNTTKRYVPVEKTSESKKPERLIPKGHRVLHRKTTTVPEKTRVILIFLSFRAIVLHTNTSDHNLYQNSNSRPTSNEQSSSKAVPKVVP